MKSNIKENSSINREIKNPKRKIKKKRSRLKYKIRMFLFYAIMLLFIAGIGVFISFTVLFKIETINVNGASRYSSDDIIKISGIKKGNNLFLSKTNEGEKNIELYMPYIESVEIKRKIPGEININVTEPKPKAQIESDEKYIVINSKNKVVDILEKPLDNVCIIKANGILNPDPGYKLMFSDEGNDILLNSVFNAIDKNGINNINFIDISNATHIFIDYDKRIKIKLGDSDNIDYKLKTAENVLGKLLPTDKGRLDVSLSVKNNQTYFAPEYFI